MWFKNIRLYCFTKPFELSPEDLESRLSEKLFQPCSSHDKTRMGWISPIAKDGEMLTHVVGDYIMICAQRQDRILPASVVKDATDEKVVELEERQGRKVYRKEKQQIQEDTFASLLPRAFTRNQKVFAYLAPTENLLVINTVSAPRAEELLSLLRESIGSLSVALPVSKRAPGDVMTRWLKNQNATHKFQIEEDCELYDPIDGSNVVRCKGQDLFADEIQTHLSAGKQVRKLGVSWKGLLNCIIADDLTVKRLKFEDIKEENESFQEESAAQKFDQEFALMTLELSGFLQSFFSAFGGLDDPGKAAVPEPAAKD